MSSLSAIDMTITITVYQYIITTASTDNGEIILLQSLYLLQIALDF